MNTLIVSNYLTKKLLEDLPNIVCSKWGEHHQSLADFACVVLDLKLDIIVEVHQESVPSVDLKGYSFYGLSNDVIRLLQAGGVVICINYYTFINLASLLYGSKILNAIFEKRQTQYMYEHKFIGQEETSYDWLDLSFLWNTKLDRMDARPGQYFNVTSKTEVVNKYFTYVTEYHKVIEGIRRESGALQGKLRSNFRTDTMYTHEGVTDDDVDVLGVSEVTEEPIAVSIKYRGFPGTLVFLPTYDIPKSNVPPPNNFEDLQAYKERACEIAVALYNLGEYYYEINRRELGVKLESPPWLLKYRTKQAIEADKELESLEARKAELIPKRDRYDRMLSLINGTGDPLEETTIELFGEQWLGFHVERTKKGHQIDFFVKNAGQTLAVQVTGVTGKFTQSDKHFGALMNYMPENEEKNTNGYVERIVLVVNTYRDKPLESRTDEDDVSPPVLRLVERNGICLIRSIDLYNMWKIWVESPKKLPADDIFKQLFNCQGMWHKKTKDD